MSPSKVMYSCLCLFVYSFICIFGLICHYCFFNFTIYKKLWDRINFLNNRITCIAWRSRRSRQCLLQWRTNEMGGRRQTYQRVQLDRGTKQVREEAQALASRIVGPHHHEEQLQRFPLVDRRQLEELVQACQLRCFCLAAHARTQFPLLFLPNFILPWTEYKLVVISNT